MEILTSLPVIDANREERDIVSEMKMIKNYNYLSTKNTKNYFWLK